MGAHAILSPSSASRWLSCTPSARLEADFPNKTSAAAEEGTVAHELAELNLKRFFDQITKSGYAYRMAALTESKYLGAEMIGHVEDYVTFVIECYNDIESKSRGAHVFLEQRYDMTEWVPEGFGTGDVAIVGDRVLHFIDLKYGKGVPVSSVQNRQMMLYALAAYRWLSVMYDIELVRMTIYQPRIDNTSTWDIPVKDLLHWGGKELRPKAAMAWKGEGVLKVGDHCRFCRAAPRCRALSDHNLSIAKNEFKQAELLSDDEIADVLDRIDSLTLWAKAVANFALSEAIRGKRWRGWKVVEGRSQRKISNEKAALAALTAAGFSVQDVTNTKLKGIGDLEKYLKKEFGPILGAHVIKPSGAPTLAPVTDKRPEFNSAEKDFEDFFSGQEE